MISIQKYLAMLPPGTDASAETSAFCDALSSLSARLLEAAGIHLLSRSHPALSSFASQLDTLRARLGEPLRPEEIASLADSAVDILSQHRETAAALDQLNTEEVQRMVAMLNSTIAVLSAGSERSLGRLKQLERDLVATTAIQDIVALRSRLSDCLQYVREEADRERKQHAREVAGIEQTCQKIQENIAVARAGVAGRAEAEQSLAQAASNPSSSSYVVVVVLTRAGTVASRFGKDVAERFLQLFARDLVDLLPSPKAVFRWSDQALLAHLDYSGAAAQLKLHLQKQMATIPATRKMELGQRAAMLLNTHQWTMFALRETAGLPDAIRRIDLLGNL